MKTTVFEILIFATIFLASLNAQIANSSFEDWNAEGNPISWQAANAAPAYTTITKSSDAHAGSWAVEGNVVQFSIFTIGPSLYSGEEAQGIPIGFQPQALEGYYKLSPVQDDFMQVQVHLQKNGELIGVGANNLTPAAVYTKFSVGITYNSAEIPDTVLIAIFVASLTGFPHVGTNMHIDDLAWGSATDLNDNLSQTPGQFILDQNYPNPFNPSTKISWQSPVSGHQTLKVYDVLGNEVTTLVDEYRPAGSYETGFSAEGLTGGIYFYKLQAGSFSGTKKMILLR